MEKNDGAFRAALQALDEELESRFMIRYHVFTVDGHGTNGIAARPEGHGLSPAETMVPVL